MDDYTEQKKWVCNCRHSRGSHDSTFSRIPDNGEEHVPGRKDGDCRVSDCNCTAFVPSDFKYESFEKDTINGLRREVVASNGTNVLFVVDGVELSIMANASNFQDFDHLSEEILAEVAEQEKAESVVFKWMGGGFQKLDE